MRGHGLALLFVVFLFLEQNSASAAARTWTGASSINPFPPNDNFWTNQFNWSGNVAPVAGDDLVFNGGIQANSVNTFMANTTFNSITINNHAISGQPIALNTGLSGTGS